MLKRKIQKAILDYFQSDSNKILIIDGARQIGKSFIIRHEGQKFFKNYIELNFLEDKNGERLFENLTSPKDFYLKLSAVAGEKIGTKADTLVFLDEIQHVENFQVVVDSLYIKDNVDIYITGSNAYMLSSELATYLSGRYIEISMLPLSFDSE